MKTISGEYHCDTAFPIPNGELELRVNGYGRVNVVDSNAVIMITGYNP